MASPARSINQLVTLNVLGGGHRSYLESSNLALTSTIQIFNDVFLNGTEPGLRSRALAAKSFNGFRERETICDIGEHDNGRTRKGPGDSGVEKRMPSLHVFMLLDGGFDRPDV